MHKQRKEILRRIEEAKLNHPHYLNLNSLGLTEVPSEIFDLTSLRELNLSNNCLMNLPPKISELPNLDYLDLSLNAFNYVNGIGFNFPCYSGIRKINLSNNNLKKIPEDLFNLEYLEDVNFHRNPLLEEIPEIIIEDGFQAIASYFEEIQLSKLTDKLYEAKLIFVGQGEVGKTTLVKKIMNPKYEVEIGKEKTTHGIKIKKWNTNLKFRPDAYFRYFGWEFEDDYLEYVDVENDFDEESEEDSDFIYKPITLNIWDFGGQEVYYSTHQFFLTKRSIYIFVWDARKEEEINSFDYWFSIISILSKSSPIIIVLNKTDVRIKYIDEQSLKREFPNIIGFFETSCVSGKGISDLKEQIMEAFIGLPHLGDRLPKSWVEIRQELVQLKKDFISYNDYLQICKKHDFTQRRADYFSDYFHDLGDILHYKEDTILKNLIILNPEWATKAVYQLIDNLEIQRNFGKFSYSNLSMVWNSYKYPNEKHIELVRLMERFEICFRLLGTDNFIIPELLPPQSNFEIDIFTEKSELKFEYTFPFLPAGLIPRFICRSFFIISNDHFWKTGVVLNYEESYALVIGEQINKKVKIYIKGDEKVELLGIIRKEFDIIFNSLKLEKDQNYFEMIPCICSECQNSKSPFFYKFSTLKLFKKKNKNIITCQKSVEDVEIKSMIKGFEKGKIKENVLKHILIAASQLQGNHKIINKNEDSRNQFISNVLTNRGIIAKEQSRWGTTKSRKNQGELDIKIENQLGMAIGVFEGFNLKSLDNSKIHLHLEKIFLYDANGLENNYIVIYSDAVDFIDLWEKYKKSTISANYQFKLLGGFENLSAKYSYGNELKIGKTTHLRKEKKCYLFHIFINLNYQS